MNGPTASTVEFTPTNDGGVLLDLHHGEFYALNPVAALAWTHLNNGTSIETTAAILCDTYEVAGDVARTDVTALAEELASRNLLPAAS